MQCINSWLPADTLYVYSRNGVLDCMGVVANNVLVMSTRCKTHNSESILGEIASGPVAMYASGNT